MCTLATHSGLPVHDDTIGAHTDIVKVAVRTAPVHSVHTSTGEHVRFVQPS